MRSIALLVYLSVPLCLCVLCGHLSQPGISCWLGVRAHATFVIGAIRNSDDIAISLWALSRYRDQKKSTIRALKKHNFQPISGRISETVQDSTKVRTLNLDTRQAIEVKVKSNSATSDCLESARL